MTDKPAAEGTKPLESDADSNRVRRFGFHSFLTHWPLIAFTFAAIDGVIHLYIGRVGPSFNLVEFAEQFSAAVFIYAGLLILSWVFAWVVLSFLGGVRPGIAFLFVLMYWSLYVGIVDRIDLSNRALSDKLIDMAQATIVNAGVWSFLLTIILILVIAKLSRRRGIPPIALNAVGLLALLAVEMVFTIAIVCLHFPGTRFALSVAAFAIPALPSIAVYWLLRKSRMIIHLATWIAFILILVPLPKALVRPDARRPPTGFVARSHTIKHVVLITIDTLRHDVVSTYNPKGVTSNIDQIAHDGTAFAHAFSSAPWTIPAVASIMTGLTPQVHETITWASALPNNADTLAEYFSAAGYRTAAVGDNFLLTPRIGIDQGFHEYNWYPSTTFKAKAFNAGLAHWLYALPLRASITTGRVTDLAVKWLRDNANENFFLWVHYYDPHMPYTPPRQYLKMDDKHRDLPTSFASLGRTRTGLEGRTQEDRDWVRSLYEGEVRYVDANVGRLLETLRSSGLYDDTLIVLTSDHGEELWDHNGFEHGHTLYNELLNVPLFIKRPHDHGNQSVDAYVGTASLAPTLLELCGISQHLPSAMAPPITVLLDNPSASFVEAPIVSTGLLYFEQKESIIFERKKYIHCDLSEREELFDLVKDPKELHSLTDQDGPDVQHARDLLSAATASAAEQRQQLKLDEGKAVNRDQQDLQTIHSIGYL